MDFGHQQAASAISLNNCSSNEWKKMNGAWWNQGFWCRYLTFTFLGFCLLNLKIRLIIHISRKWNIWICFALSIVMLVYLRHGGLGQNYRLMGGDMFWVWHTHMNTFGILLSFSIVDSLFCCIIVILVYRNRYITYVVLSVQMFSQRFIYFIFSPLPWHWFS